jgi:HSP20 family protein
VRRECRLLSGWTEGRLARPHQRPLPPRSSASIIDVPANENLTDASRSSRSATFPHINIGTIDSTIEIVAFAPGVDPAKLDISVDKGLLSIAGERSTQPQPLPEGTRQYAQERFSGSFRRIIELPPQADPDKVQARYADGCLLISVGKREASQPRAITVQ